jgi:hypothetical protein
MALTAAIIITGISLGLLLIYAADVAVAQGDSDGFLPFDHSVRGFGLGGPAMILPIIAFFISRKEPSSTLAAMLIASGILIVIGGVTVIVISDPAEVEESGRSLLSMTAPLMVVGSFIIALGAIKFKKR